MAGYTLIIPGEVVPKQSMRVRAVPYFNDNTRKCDAFIKTYQKKEVTDYEKKVEICCMEQLGVNFTPITGAIKMIITIVCEIPKSMTKTDQAFIAQGGIIYKTTLPDLTDNLIKGICDGMQGRAYVNDGQICVIESQKIYGTDPRAIVTIIPISEKLFQNPIFE